MDVSVIIPTYNRSTQLTATLDSLLGCDTAGLEQVEIIVVDDGSPHPVAPLVESPTVRPPISLAPSVKRTRDRLRPATPDFGPRR